jgi:hypothetical protein
VQHVGGSQQCLGIAFEYPARISGHPGEQRDRRVLPLEQARGLQHTRAQAGITGGRGHPRTQDHLI